NSYLIGAQIKHARFFCESQSCSANVEIYRQILLSGCRCVELDSWDGSDGEPVITHGPMEITSIQPVPFKDVCEAIAESAFKTSEYPVCLSIENHCCKVQQKRMVSIFQKVFEGMLLTQPLSDFPLKPNVNLPSPLHLKRKILIKARKKPLTVSTMPSFSAATESGDSSILQKGASTDSAVDLAQSSTRSLSVDHSLPSEETSRRESISSDSSTIQRNSRAVFEMAVDESDSSGYSTSSSENNLAKIIDEEQAQKLLNSEYSGCCAELSCLVNYLEALPSSDLKLTNSDEEFHHHMHSLSEKKVHETIVSSSAQLAKHTAGQIIRVYPDGYRFTSTNYMPLCGWLVGIQMMALNFQTKGLEMQMNSTLFEESRSCGYVLKPLPLREHPSEIKLFGEHFHPTVIPNRIEIWVIY
ncbi:hypothetical protein AB6A40_009376, partial [Gnathostoma spinigerum]